MNKNLKPTGLKGREVNNRMMELMGINENTTVTTNDNQAVKLTKRGPDGKIYGIVKENHKYFIKVCATEDNVVAESFNYIGGLGNKVRESFPSYEKATRRLAHKFSELARGKGLYFEGNVLINDNLLTENVPLGAGSMGFAPVAEEAESEDEVVEEMEDINGDNLVHGKKDTDNETPTKEPGDGKAEDTGDHKVGDAGHDVHVMEVEAPASSGIAGAGYGFAPVTEDLDAVGDEDADIDNDGDEDEEDEYLKNKRQKISTAIEEIEEMVDAVLENSGKKKA